MRVFLILLVSTHSVFAGFGRYSDLVVADAPAAQPPRGGVRITYLGTNGYQLEAGGHSLLIDPYFSRVCLSRVALGWPIHPDPEQFRANSIKRPVDAILVTHGHFDHLLDVPELMKKTGARLVASNTSVEVARRAGAPSNKCDGVVPGSHRTLGPWQISVFSASHDRLPLMGVPFNGTLKGNGAPVTAGDWVCGQPLSYLIATHGIKIFVDSGGTPSILPPGSVGPVDMAILGVALPGSRARFAAAVQRLHPRYILPSHQDNFFVPLRRGFQFGALSDFPFVRRIYGNEHLPGKLILLDYFRPWTLPRA